MQSLFWGISCFLVKFRVILNMGHQEKYKKAQYQKVHFLTAATIQILYQKGDVFI